MAKDKGPFDSFATAAFRFFLSQLLALEPTPPLRAIARRLREQGELERKTRSNPQAGGRVKNGYATAARAIENYLDSKIAEANTLDDKAPELDADVAPESQPTPKVETQAETKAENPRPPKEETPVINIVDDVGLPEVKLPGILYKEYTDALERMCAEKLNAIRNETSVKNLLPIPEVWRPEPGLLPEYIPRDPVLVLVTNNFTMGDRAFYSWGCACVCADADDDESTLRPGHPMLVVNPTKNRTYIRSHPSHEPAEGKWPRRSWVKLLTMDPNKSFILRYWLSCQLPGQPKTNVTGKDLYFAVIKGDFRSITKDEYRTWEKILTSK